MFPKASILDKIRQKSIREILVRGKHLVTQHGEWLIGIGQGELTDSALLKEVVGDKKSGSCEGVACEFLERIQGVFVGNSRETNSVFPYLQDRERIVSIIESRFPHERAAIIRQADDIVDCHFDLLGFTGLYFGEPIDWNYEPITGKRTDLQHWSRVQYLNPNTAGDKKVTWELNRHAHFVTLGQAYWLTKHERYADAFVNQWLSWIDANPPKRGINWVSSLELALRCIAWLWALRLFSDSPKVNTRFMVRFIKSLLQHGWHIESYLSYYFSPNTHLTGEALGLLYLGIVMPQFKSASRWRELGLKILLREVSRQVQSDGVYFEQASYYHRYTADFYIHLLLLARAADISMPLEVTEKLCQLLEHLMWITKPCGSSSLYGDDDGGRLLKLSCRRANDFRDTLGVGASLFGRRDWKHVAGSDLIEILWLLGPEGLRAYDRIQPSPPLLRAKEFVASGYYVLRDGWCATSSYVLFDCGHHGALTCGHAHSDALSFEFASAGVEWIVDPGTYTYTGNNDYRDLFRSSQAHSTVVVEGQSQCMPAGPFSWDYVADARVRKFSVAPGSAIVRGDHDGYARLSPSLSHSRTMVLLDRCPIDADPAYLAVIDRIESQKEYGCQIRFRLSASCKPRLCSDGAVIVESNGAKLIFSSWVVSGDNQKEHVSLKVDQGVVSSCYGKLEPASIIVADWRTRSEQFVVSMMVPFCDGAKVKCENIADAWMVDGEIGQSYLGRLYERIPSEAFSKFEEEGRP